MKKMLLVEWFHDEDIKFTIPWFLWVWTEGFSNELRRVKGLVVLDGPIGTVLARLQKEAGVRTIRSTAVIDENFQIPKTAQKIVS